MAATGTPNAARSGIPSAGAPAPETSTTSQAPAGAWLLVTDVDDTFLDSSTRDDPTIAGFNSALGASGQVRLALNSSRPIASVTATLGRLSNRVSPDAIVGALGTEIEIAGAPDRGWQGRLGEGWDRDQIDQVMRGLDLAPHDPEFQTPFKVSYAVPPERRDEVLAALRATGLAMRTIISGASDFDVIPERAGKDAATRYLADHFGVDPAARLVVAGDSANDLAMFEASPRGIVVGNARDELRQAVDPERCYFANAPYSAGLLEGLRFFGAPVGGG